MPLMITSILVAEGIGNGFPSNPKGKSKGNTATAGENNVISGSASKHSDEFISGIKNSNIFSTYNAIGKTNTNKNSAMKSNGKSNNNSGQQSLSTQEQKVVSDLQKTDSKVKAHENAHRTSGAGLIRGVTSFTYTTGPDGKQYATGGEVQIDVSPVNGDPEATIQKMERVRAAALAPVDPSAQDRSVAALASSIVANAMIQEAQQNSNVNNSVSRNSNIAINVFKNADQNIYQSQQENNKESIYTGIEGSITTLKQFIY